MSETPQEAKVAIAIRQAWCKGCGICIAFCPKKVYEADAYGHPKVTDESKCILCMLCVQRCPDFAIDVEKRSES